jgi:hypothetical protein
MLLLPSQIMMSLLLLCATTEAAPPSTDYCDMLGQDDIQGKKTGFLAGNKVYYVGGTFLVWDLFENETIGLTHPFFHDLRSRGTGIATYQGVGTGNDFDGWEWYRATKVAYGSVVTPETRWERPAPTRMYWRPDKMIIEYELSNPNLHGEFTGWCHDWKEGSSNGTGLGKSFWVNLTKSTCFGHCKSDSACHQAVYEADGVGQCWIGLNRMANKPDPSRPGKMDTCFAQGPEVKNVTVREEKFIAENDVVSTIITASRPITLEISGNSFDGGGGSGTIISLHGTCDVDVDTNSIHIVEGGVVKAKVGQSPDVFEEGPLMLNGMSGVLSASHKMENVSMYKVSAGVCGYTFHVPVDSTGTTVSWAMDDQHSKAVAAVQEALSDPAKHLAAKTAKTNRILNTVVPYFRCSDEDIVKVYYFLWSIFLMYYTKGDTGMQLQSHTQSAVNNFLGMHRYDAIFQVSHNNTPY